MRRLSGEKTGVTVRGSCARCSQSVSSRPADRSKSMIFGWALLLLAPRKTDASSFVLNTANWLVLATSVSCRDSSDTSRMSERVLIPTEEFRRNRTERPPGDHRGFEIGPEASFTGLFRRFISRFVYQSSRSVGESSRPNRQAAPPGATRHQ